MAQNKKAQEKGFGKKWIVPTVAGIICLAVVLGFAARPGSRTESAGEGDTAVNTDIVIPISEVSDTAKFYSARIDDTKLEVLAVKAPDGSIRTAFNTCQICYSSGRGYYKQEGDVLVCQNCGNRFAMSQVEIESGGCNPVPIFDENKSVSDTNIMISADYLKEATAIFANWKTEY